MQAFHTPSPSCLHIKVYITTFKNGVMLSFSAVYSLMLSVILFLHIHGSLANPQELFNLQHASAHNIVENMFSILKNHLAILRSNPNLDIDIQAMIALALAAIHKVIQDYDEEELEALLQQAPAADMEPSHSEATGNLAEGPARTAERCEADTRRDEIANNMWLQYRAEL
jgi:hypothetical protein